MTTSIQLEGMTDEQVETVKAFARAVKNHSTDNIEYLETKFLTPEWEQKTGSGFDFRTAYRIKPQPKIVEFDFSDAGMLIGKAIKKINRDDTTWMIMGADENTVHNYSIGSLSYKYLLKNFTFLDGSPCGKTEVTK